jgi:drug/metabolite transporter (DMT)-like permease
MDNERMINSIRSVSYTTTSETYSKVTNIKFVLLNIIVGQILAVLNVTNGIVSDIIENDKKIVIPLFLISLFYLSLFIFWIIIRRKIVYPKLIFIFITIFHSQAIFLNIYAFSVIHFSYLFIINVSTVFWTVLFSCIFIRDYKYHSFHIYGVLICLIGVIITLYGCMSSIEDKEDLFNNYKGLLYTILSSILYSM